MNHQKTWKSLISLCLSFLAGVLLCVYLKIALLALVALVLAVLAGTFHLLRHGGWLYFGLPTVGLTAALVFCYLMQV